MIKIDQRKKEERNKVNYMIESINNRKHIEHKLGRSGIAVIIKIVVLKYC